MYIYFCNQYIRTFSISSIKFGDASSTTRGKVNNCATHSITLRPALQFLNGDTIMLT